MKDNKYGVCINVEVEQPEGAMSAVGMKSKYWETGQTLRIRFLGGDFDESGMLLKAYDEWFRYANLKYEVVTDGESDIRVSFEKGLGSWSYLGTDALAIPQHRATMNIGWENSFKTHLHETGHSLGLCHEHQNPEGGLRWNTEAVIKSLSGPPNNWSESQIRRNVTNHLDTNLANGTEFDPDSIMLYEFPSSWSLDGTSTKSNSILSDMDKKFISEVYPYSTQPGEVGEGREAAVAVVRSFVNKTQLKKLYKSSLLKLGKELEVRELSGNMTKAKILEVLIPAIYG